MSSRPWSIFRTVRIVIFALSTLLSLTWTIIFTTLLFREWKAYNVGQRVTVILALTVNGISAVFLYLMIVVKFRLWLDAARVAFIIVFQLGSTITFALFSSNLPCDNLGSKSNCKNVTMAVVNGGWALSGLLLVYAFYLAVMSYVPLPQPPPNPESMLSSDKRSPSPAPSAHSQTQLLKSKGDQRESINSAYSHRSFIQTYNPSLYRDDSSIRSPSVASPRYGVYRPNTPTSFHSSASGSISSYHGPKDVPPPATSPYLHPLVPLHPPEVLPNPFTDPISRQNTPVSVASFSSFRSDEFTYDRGRGQYLPTPLQRTSPLKFGVNNNHTLSPPPYADRRSPSPYYARSYVSSGPPYTGSYLTVPETPMSLRPSVQSNVPSREFTASPGIYSIHSLAASLHSPTRSASLADLPISPRRAIPPPPPQIARRTNGVRRYGSLPE